MAMGLCPNMSKNDYVESVQRAKQYIEDGDIYQANLSQRFETSYPGDPFDLYLKFTVGKSHPLFPGF